MVETTIRSLRDKLLGGVQKSAKDRGAGSKGSQNSRSSAAGGKGGKGGKGGGKAAGKNLALKSYYESYYEIKSAAEASDKKSLLTHDCARGEESTRAFLRIRPSALNWKRIGWLCIRARRSGERDPQQEERVVELKEEWKKLSAVKGATGPELQTALEQLSKRFCVQCFSQYYGNDGGFYIGMVCRMIVIVAIVVHLVLL